MNGMFIELCGTPSKLKINSNDGSIDILLFGRGSLQNESNEE